MAKSCAEGSSKQKHSKTSRTDLKSNTKIGVKLLHLSPILHWFYSMRYMVSFWCGNTLLEGDFKNTKTYQNKKKRVVYIPKKKTFFYMIFYLHAVKVLQSSYQNMRRQQVVRPLLLYLEKFNQIDS